ncbi:hypothetical protein RB608_02015 [Nocardioides sp. LHD-245]|uniref:hypothetical protein n=1 Tax=Nocardioides sp. LHD-245 TaxID=3051387 RepID=UPI0027E037E4|nr:hypothetical protein [Nocardioides sp. LHD-245]
MAHFHLSSRLNRASISTHGLDWSRMGAAPGIAGSDGPEVEGCFLCDEGEVDWFIRINNTGGPVDLWQVDGVADDDLVEFDTGYSYLPERIPPRQVRLVRTDIPPVAFS